MKGVMFNIDNGYLEGLCRGFKNGKKRHTSAVKRTKQCSNCVKKCFTLRFSGVLSQNDYLNLVQCETLEDLKLHLQSTDYGNFLASESSLQVLKKDLTNPPLDKPISRCP